jgi:4-amino-4-deoxy-L-arabinose transferase-like glycosyltransferase
MARPKRPPAADRRAPRQLLLPALAAALTLLLRLGFILEMRGTPFSTVSPQMVDAWYYHRQALDILHRSFIGTEVFFLRPLYPYLLAGVYAVFGPSLFAVQLLQALLGSAACLLLHDLTRRLFGRPAAAVAAFGFALAGILIFYTGTLLYVELTVFLGLLVAWLVVIEDKRWWRWPATGLALGLLVICRPEFLVILPIAVLILAGQGRRARPLAVMTAVALAVVAAVPLRNLLVARDPVLFTAHSGINFYYGNNPAADGTWQPAPDLDPAAGFSHERLKLAARVVDGREVAWSRASNHWLRRGLGWLAADPARAGRLLARKFLLFWSDYEVPGNYYPETARASSLVLRFALVGFGLGAALGLVGMAFAWPLRRRAWPAYAFVGVFLASALAFYVMSRLRAPVLPFLLAFAGLAVARLAALARARRFGRLAVGLAAAAALFTGSLLVPADRAGYSSQAWTQQGNIELGRRRAGPALESFRRALAANPGNPSARYSLIILLAGAGRAAEAEAEHRELVRRFAADPATRPLLHLAAGRLAIARRDFPAAAGEYRAAAAADPAAAETWYLLGLVYVSMDSLAAARAALGRALAVDPAHSEARAVLGRLPAGADSP